MPFSLRLLLAFALSLILFSLFGCGEKTVVASGSTKSEQSQTCIDCHQSVISPVTGKAIVEEWKLSHHNTSNAAGCADCHEPEQGHPTGCNLCHGGTPVGASKHVSKNPDEDKKCDKCHGRTSGLFPKGTRREHYGDNDAASRYIGFEKYTASYVSTNYIGKCRKCHNPHDPTTNIEYNRSWAKSGHGDVAAGPRTNRDFKLYGTNEAVNLTFGPVCVRCHTTTGFVNFVESKFTDVRPFGTSADKTKEVTGCDACHSNYGFARRAVPRVTIYYNFSGVSKVSVGNPGGHAKIQNNAVLYPDFGASNMCIPCHAGRGVGSEITTLQNMGIDFSRITSPSSHDFSGAAILTSKSGYEFSGKEYKSGTGANTGHDETGLDTGKGPCITCHMNKITKSDSHTFKPVLHDAARFYQYTSSKTWAKFYSVNFASPAALKISSITSQSCNTSGCHVGLSATELNRDKDGYISALAALNQWVRLVRNVPVGAPANPVCSNTTNAPRLLTKWDYYGTGPDLMGAAFNLATFNNEPGAYVHNPLYAKRLVYDSISYLMLAESKASVADAIQSLVNSTRLYYTAKTGKTAGVALLCSDYTSDTVAITQQQADSAIAWLYGSSSPSDKMKRPGDN